MTSRSWRLDDPYYILCLHQMYYYFVFVQFGDIYSLLLYFKNILTFSFAVIQCPLAHMDARFDDASVCMLSVSNSLNKPAVLPRCLLWRCGSVRSRPQPTARVSLPANWQAMPAMYSLTNQPVGATRWRKLNVSRQVGTPSPATVCWWFDWLVVVKM